MKGALGKIMLKEVGQKGDFQPYISEVKKFVNSKLSNLVSSLSKLKLYSQIEYAVLSEGKRLRPILVILSAESVGGDRKRIVPLALAFELLHTATLVHDDIIDEDEMRRCVPTLYKRYSLSDAILVGDELISMAIDLAADFGSEVTKIVAKSGLSLCEGEHMDTSQLLSTTTEYEYLIKIKNKSASLFSAAAQCGALASGGSRYEAESLALFGESLGMAYQLRDDLTDLTASKSIPRDLRTERITLPLIHLYEVSKNVERDALESHLQILRDGKSKASNSVFRGVLRSLEMMKSIRYCEEKIAEYVQRAAASIELLEDTEYRMYLVQMAKLLAPSAQDRDKIGTSLVE